MGYFWRESGSLKQNMPPYCSKYRTIYAYELDTKGVKDLHLEVLVNGNLNDHLHIEATLSLALLLSSLIRASLPRFHVSSLVASSMILSTSLNTAAS